MPSQNLTTSLACQYCGLNGHCVKSCPRFVSLGVPERVCWVCENKVCVKCLRKGKHNYRRCKARPCGIDGCNQIHNKLLHCANHSHVSSHQNVNKHLHFDVTSVCQEPSTSHVNRVVPDSHKQKTSFDSHKGNYTSSNEVSSQYKNNDTITSTTYSYAPINENAISLKVYLSYFRALTPR
jgi:hypothetical protein